LKYVYIFLYHLASKFNFCAKCLPTVTSSYIRKTTTSSSVIPTTLKVSTTFVSPQKTTTLENYGNENINWTTHRVLTTNHTFVPTINTTKKTLIPIADIKKNAEVNSKKKKRT